MLYRCSKVILGTLIFLRIQACHAEGPTVLSFTKLQISDKFWSEGAAIADINRDGHADIVAGPFWYEGPDFKKRHEIFPATQTFKRKGADGIEETVEGFEGALGTNNAYSNVFFEFAYDFNHDGWPDILVIGFPGEEAAWYENPGPAVAETEKNWVKHVVIDGVGNESPEFIDLFATGTPVILCTRGVRLGYVAPSDSNAREPWTFHAISAPLKSLEYLTQAFSVFRKPICEWTQISRQSVWKWRCPRLQSRTSSWLLRSTVMSQTCEKLTTPIK